MNEKTQVFERLSIKAIIFLLVIPLLSAVFLFGSATLILLNIPELKPYTVTIISWVLFVQAVLWLVFVNVVKKKYALSWQDL